MPSRSGVTRVIVTLAFVLAACGDAPLTWYYRLADGIEEVALLEARIRADGCEGPVIHEQRFAPGDAMTPPALAAGEYGFEIEVRDADCNVIGAGCLPATPPVSGGSITVEVLADPQGSACEPGMACDAGRCVGEDADAGTDAGAGTDGGARDAGECAGCWDGDTCVAGDSPAACGAGGGACETCGCGGDVCTAGACVPSEPVVSVAAGLTHTCAIAGGVLHCWGSGEVGQLGEWSSPRDMPAPTDARAGWVEVSTSTYSTCARRGAELHCWGSNNYGQLGIGAGMPENVATITEVAGARSWSRVSVGSWHTLGIDDAGNLFCWGQGMNESCAVRDGPESPEPQAIGADTWDDVCAGLWQSCGIRDGVLYCWGWSSDGETGTGVTGASVDSVTRVDDATDWSEVACGVGHTCARREDGRVFCFGCGDDSCYSGIEEACGGDCSGSLGTGIAASSATPVEVTGLEARTIDAGTHTCAVAMDGTLHCWGSNADGQLGTGDTASRDAPARVPGDRWSDVSAGQRHTCAIREGGALYCWGRNEERQLGTGGPIAADTLIPTRVCVD